MCSVRDRSKLDRIEINNEKIIRKRKRRKEKGAISYATRGGKLDASHCSSPGFYRRFTRKRADSKRIASVSRVLRCNSVRRPFPRVYRVVKGTSCPIHGPILEHGKKGKRISEERRGRRGNWRENKRKEVRETRRSLRNGKSLLETLFPFSLEIKRERERKK